MRWDGWEMKKEREMMRDERGDGEERWGDDDDEMREEMKKSRGERREREEEVSFNPKSV